MTQAQFIAKANSVHDNFYDYSKTIYTGFNKPVIITCPLHGDFEKIARRHFRHKCYKCSLNTKYLSRNYSYKQEDFIAQALLKHGSKYDYSLVDYKNSYTKVEIICPQHNVFTQSPKNHLQSKGCYACGRTETGAQNKRPVEISEMIARFKTIHGNNYDYSQTEIVGAKTSKKEMIKIICKEHGLFEQQIDSHLNGNGCNKCRYFGYTRTAYINNCEKRGHSTSEYYIVRFYNETESFIKLGITTQTIKTRYRKQKERGFYNFEILFSIHLSPAEAWDTERFYKSAMLPFKYQPKNDFPGSTECFSMQLPVEKIISSFSDK